MTRQAKPKDRVEVVLVEIPVLVRHYGATDEQIREKILRDVSVGGGMWTSERGGMSLYSRRDARAHNERVPGDIRWYKKQRRIG